MPYVEAAEEILTELKNWILALGGIVTVVVCISHGLGYQAASAAEKSDKLKAIKHTIAMGAGISFLAWFALYVYDYFKNIQA